MILTIKTCFTVSFSVFIIFDDEDLVIRYHGNRKVYEISKKKIQ